uniref:Uncharacterized protein n=1 Tax=Chromera velia CCMP2878 TaxID=1169474 RepID=A0A0K6S9S6_9ALVE|eukprot:Cvel_8052.t2-p1 / transcript=Cvel_8052.t2 / gene=Cvel_8052 / organism=Chromera_velia_CCMP2878 / gene_product=hypothetical protein / transcript_product=hypothetical protein / location=Cvel_scaffold435:82754-86538(+) / protein_length=265 / sequence_SO=supercontig / SO=protein_coding / is_pseudo=false
MEVDSGIERHARFSSSFSPAYFFPDVPQRAAKQAEQYVLSLSMAREGGEGTNASVLPPAASAGQSLWGGYLEMIAQHQGGELDGDTEGMQGSQANGSGQGGSDSGQASVPKRRDKRRRQSVPTDEARSESKVVYAKMFIISGKTCPSQRESPQVLQPVLFILLFFERVRFDDLLSFFGFESTAPVHPLNDAQSFYFAHQVAVLCPSGSVVKPGIHPSSNRVYFVPAGVLQGPATVDLAAFISIDVASFVVPVQRLFPDAVPNVSQ